MLEPGHIFASRYRIQRCIAEGGMAAIFEAEHLGTERRVALKLLFPHIMSIGSAREKFELEAKISARVNSPHIVQVWDAGIDPESGSPFLAMELLEGETLARRVATHGPLPLEQALSFLEQVAAGLDAAHGYREPGGAAKPIVHRDLKPENLFLSLLPGGSVSAKILDYGIAKVLDDRLHVSQEVRGTPLFMAIEQITGSPLSPQTDIWAYGLIAHFTLTGAHYWRTAALEDASVQALFAEIVTLPLDAPSARWRELSVASTPPPAFDGWLLRCIDREPARRFPKATLAFEALREALGGAPPSPAEVEPKAASVGATPVAPARAGASVEATSEAAPEARIEAGLARASRRRSTALASHGSAASSGSVPALARTQQRASLAVLAARMRRSRSLAAVAGVAAVAAGLAAWAVGGSAPTPHALGSDARDTAPLQAPGAPSASEAAPSAASMAPALTPSLDVEAATPALTPEPAALPPVRVAPLVEPAAVSSSEVAPAPPVAPSTRVAPVQSASRRSPAARVTSPVRRSSSAARSEAASGARRPEPVKARPRPATGEAYRIR